MSRKKMIQLQGSVIDSIGKITNDVRLAVSKACLGIDDMQMLGNKALVLRAEIYPDKLELLYSSLHSLGIKLKKQSMPDVEVLSQEVEYPLSIQITSFSGDTDRRNSIPKVPG